MIVKTLLKYKIFEFVLDHLFTTLKKNLMRPKLDDLPTVVFHTESNYETFEPILHCDVIHNSLKYSTAIPLETVQDIKAIVSGNYLYEIAALLTHILIQQVGAPISGDILTYVIEEELGIYLNNSSKKVSIIS